jgi:hypothetical protein
VQPPGCDRSHERGSQQKQRQQAKDKSQRTTPGEMHPPEVLSPGMIIQSCLPPH